MPPVCGWRYLAMKGTEFPSAKRLYRLVQMNFLQKFNYFKCFLRDHFQVLVQHLSNSIYNAFISGVKSSWTSLQTEAETEALPPGHSGASTEDGVHENTGGVALLPLLSSSWIFYQTFYSNSSFLPKKGLSK